MPTVIGLTGGIGCGKSTVARRFGELGAGVVDTDEIAHELTRPGGAAIPAIRGGFGPGFITPEGALDRARMRTHAFTDPDARKRLEAVLHPMIGAETRRRIAASTAPYVVLVVPLLLETGSYRDLLTRVLVVDCEEAQQVERTMLRSGLTAAEVRAIMATQLARAERLARADDVVSNAAGPDALDAPIRLLHERYLDLARTG